MAIKYLDFEGGNDTLDGTTFANRWKTITSGATSARIAVGDVVRIMASPDPTLVGSATWTQYSKSIILASAVTINISDCETAWSAATNITATADTTQFKENTKSAKLVSNASFTTGKIASIALAAATDFTAYQQVSFWIYNSQAIADGASLSLRLCSDTAGATTVNTIAVPAIPSTSQWVPITVDAGTALGSGIQSVALYADKAFTSKTVQIDNILACKASSDPASLTLTSLIGKVCNLSWSPSTTYAAGDQRKPTQPMRNGFRYQASAGTTGSTEPVWPQEIGVTVSDGTVTWTCVGLEDTWFAIQSINGATVKLDNITNTAGNAGRGYSGATETVATYKRETTKIPMQAGNAGPNASQKSGSDGNLIAYSGGWSRADMSAQTGETWMDGQSGAGLGFQGNNTNYIAVNNVNGTRFSTGIYEPLTGWRLTNAHWNNCSNNVSNSGSTPVYAAIGLSACNGNTSGIALSFYGIADIRQVACDSNLNNNGLSISGGTRFSVSMRNFTARNNGGVGVSLGAPNDAYFYNGTFGNNGAGTAVSLSGAGSNKSTFINCLMPEASAFSGANQYQGEGYGYSQKHNQISDNHYIYTDGGTIVSATDQRYALAGISWKFRPTSISRSSAYPLKLSVAKIRCAANTPVNLTIPTRRDNTNIKGQLVVLGGQIAGVPSDVAVDCQPTISTWAVSGTLTFTPIEDGVVEVLFRVWDGVGTTNNFWISARDLTVS